MAYNQAGLGTELGSSSFCKNPKCLYHRLRSGSACSAQRGSNEVLDTLGNRRSRDQLGGVFFLGWSR
jgi:hypothetical protein